MLRFIGSILDENSPLTKGYNGFIGEIDGGFPFMTLNCEKLDAEHSVRLSHKKVNNISFSCTEDGVCRQLAVNGYKARVEKDFSILTTHECYLTETAYGSLNELIHQAARFRALFLDMLVLHASAVVYQNETLLFSGISGAGKSTQANLWRDHMDAWVLNYDKPIVKIAGSDVLVSGSPWGGKEDLAINEVRPAKALFFVHQSTDNRVVRLSAGQAYSRMHLNYLVYPLNKDIEERYTSTLIRIIERIPVYDLFCSADYRAVEAVLKELYGLEELE